MQCSTGEKNMLMQFTQSMEKLKLIMDAEMSKKHWNKPQKGPNRSLWCRLHEYSVTILRCYKDVYVNSFFPCTARLGILYL